MNIIDIIVPIVLFLGMCTGWKDGFVTTACSLLGIIIGLIVAYLLFSVVGDWLAPSLRGDFNLANLIAFGLIWLVVPLALEFVGHTATHLLDALPLIGTLNSLAGAILGVVKYFLLTCCVINLLIYSGTIGPDVVRDSNFASFMKEFFDSFVAAYQQSKVGRHH